MHVWVTSLLLLMVSLQAIGQSGTSRRRAAAYAEEGQAAMVAGDYPRAASFYKLARKSDPRNSEFAVEEARAHFLDQEYKEVVALLQGKLRQDKGKWEGKISAYRLYGSALDMLGKTKSAHKVFEKGRAEFPKSGEMYLELGLLEWGMENDPEALRWWERGIAACPEYPDNYWMAAQLMSVAGNLAGTIIYTEQFLHLERYTNRTRVASRFLMESYQEAYTCNGMGCRFRFWKGEASEPGLVQAMGLAYTPDLESGQMTLRIRDIYLARVEASELMPERAEQMQEYFEWLAELVREGHLEAYDYWMLQDGAPDEFTDWLETNGPKFQAFETWFKKRSFYKFSRKPAQWSVPETAKEP